MLTSTWKGRNHYLHSTGGETEAAKAGICFLLEKPPETDKTNSTNNSGARLKSKKKTGIVGELGEERSLLCPTVSGLWSQERFQGEGDEESTPRRRKS